MTDKIDLSDQEWQQKLSPGTTTQREPTSVPVAG